MKKIYLLGFAALATSFGFSQSKYQKYNFGKHQAKIYNGPAQEGYRPNANAGQDRALNILWQEDFTGETINNTANPDSSWQISGTNGSYWSVSNATQAPNGYALTMDGEHMHWDSYTPVQPTETQFASTPVDGSVISPMFDLSGAGAVGQCVLEFNLNAMYCCNEEPWTIAISNDNGATWGNEIPLNIGLSANGNSKDITDPYLYSVVISNDLDNVTGANNDSCKVKFTWKGVDANGAGQMSTHYYWAIDDVKVYELPSNEVVNNKMWLADIINEYEYTNFPTSQAGTLTVQSEVRNSGINTPTNLTMEVTVFQSNGTTVVDGPVSGGTLLAAPLASDELDTMTFATSIDLSTYSVGEYKVMSVIKHDATDENTANDTLWRTFKVSENSMGHVNYDAPIVDGLANYNGTVKIGSYFGITSDISLEGLDLYLLTSGGTSVSTTLDVPVYIYVDNRTTGDYLGYYEYTLVSGMMDDWYTFNFNQAEGSDVGGPLTLTAGNIYAVTIEVQDGNTLWYNSNLEDADYSSRLYSTSQSQWFWNGEEMWTMLNFDEALNLESQEGYDFSVGQNVPNPFGNNTVINYSLDNTSDVSVKFTDVSGKVVKSINQGTQDAGTYQVDVEAGEFSEGIYFYTFTIGGKQITKRMVVTK